MPPPPFSPATLDRYERVWRRFEAWCAERRLAALPAAPETAILFLSELSRGASAVSLRLAKAAVAHHHREGGHPSPFDALPPTVTVSDLTQGGGVPQRSGVVRIDEVLPDRVQRMILAQPDTLVGVRDRALLVV